MRRFLSIISRVVVVVITLPILGVVALFCYGQVLFPEIHPPSHGAPQTFQEILWVEVGGTNPIPEKSAGITFVFSSIFKEVFGAAIGSLPRGTPTSTLAAFVAKDAMRFESPSPMRGLKRHLAGFCGSTWIASQWSPSQMLAYLSATVYLGHEFYGIESAAQGYFGSRAKDLAPNQMALLIAMLKNPHQYDPWCAPEHAVTRINDFIAKHEVHVQPVTSLTALKLKPVPGGACKKTGFQ